MTTTLDDNMVEDFLRGDFLPKFEDGETRTLEFVKYEFDDAMRGYDGRPTRGVRFYVKDLESPVKSIKKWEIKSRNQAKTIFTELKHGGNEGKGWSVMNVTRIGLGAETKYTCKGVK